MSGRNVSKEPAGETSDESFYEQYMEEKTSDGAGSMSLLKELHNIYVQHTHSNR